MKNPVSGIGRYSDQYHSRVLSWGNAVVREAGILGAAAASVVPIVRGGLLPAPWQMPHAVRALLRNGSTLALLAELAATRFPDRAAVVDEFGQLTFAELHRRAMHIAGALHREQGIGPGSTVAILARNHRHFVEALVAGSRLGAELVFLNTELTPEQLAKIVRRHQPDLVVLDGEFTAALPRAAYQGPRLTALPGPEHRGASLDSLAASGQSPPWGRRQGPITLLTSGTTGLAKSAPRSSNLNASLSLLGTAIPTLAPGSSEVIYAAPPFFHAFGLAMVAAGLALGATVVTRRRFDAEALLADIQRYRVTLLPGVPTMHQRLLDLPAEVRNRYDTSSVRLVVTAAAPLSPGLAARIMDHFGPVLVNGYGSTELGGVTLAGPEDLRAAPGTVGRPFAGVSVRILREDRTPAPTGEVGSVFVLSPMTFAGYSGDADRAKELVDGHLNTGDLGRLDAAGRLFLEGRDDDMIVSGGENVFTTEVEDVLGEHPEVADAAVVGVPDEELGSRMRAFLVPRHPESPAEPSLAELKDFVRARLERFKAPKEVAFLPEIPRNATGKVLRTQLRDLPDSALRFAKGGGHESAED